MIEIIESALCSEPFVFGCLIGILSMGTACAIMVAWYCHVDRSLIPRKGDIWAIRYGTSGSIYVRIRHASHNAVVYSTKECNHSYETDMMDDWKRRSPVLLKRRRFWLF